MKLDAAVMPNPPGPESHPIIIDSDYPPEWPCLVRFDHHFPNDNGWTNLDSIREEELTPLAAQEHITLVTSYLDPDAVISVAFLRYVLEHGGAFAPTLDGEFGRQLYAASFFADYNTACPFLDGRTNAEGSRMELWIRRRMSLALGETRGGSTSHEGVLSAVLRILADDVLDMLLLGRQSDSVARFDADAYLNRLVSVFARYIKHDIGTPVFGVIHVPATEDERVIPRAYLSAFPTPTVIRVIESKTSAGFRQVFIGVNPSIEGWKELNLVRLATILVARSDVWRMDGRRAVVGINSTTGKVEDLIELLADIKLGDFTDHCQNHTRFANGSGARGR